MIFSEPGPKHSLLSWTRNELKLLRESAASLSQPEITVKSRSKQPSHAISCFDLSLESHGIGVEEHSNNTSPVSPTRSSTPQTAIVFYSTGQFKFPKPIEVAYRCILYNLQQLSYPIVGPPTDNDKCLLAANIHHAFGLVTAFLTLKSGAQLIVTSKQNSYQIIQIIKQWKVTVLYAIPTLIHHFVNDAQLEKYDLETLKSVVISGAPVGEAIMQQCKKRLKLQDLRQAYSVTEAGGICCIAPYGQKGMKSVGIPLPGLHFKVVNWETREICMPGQLGQVLIEGPQIEVPEPGSSKQVQKVFESGYFKTGDVGYYDEAGYIYVLNKMKDVVKCKGVLLCPSEVESILRSHPGIEDCAVVGRQEQLTGTETPAAFVVKSAKYQQLASSEIRQYVAGTSYDLSIFLCFQFCVISFISV
ncbi:unnamed protein product [Gongylonema pulchrum]|uniref:AMP-binding domain-containing protein n=1 Tax=Gongylonema pulchrum TaxID=637853 RepID=A0A183EAU0_9BILA|nr:unnamed protein product [Gongylonema pulchrum]